MRFTIRDIMWLMAVVACLVLWWQHSRKQQRELEKARAGQEKAEARFERGVAEMKKAITAAQNQFERRYEKRVKELEQQKQRDSELP